SMNAVERMDRDVEAFLEEAHAAGWSGEDTQRELRKKKKEWLRQRVERRCRAALDALAWYRTERPHLEDYARAHWRQILQEEAAYRAEFADPDHVFATCEECYSAAIFTVWRALRGEVTAFLWDEFQIPYSDIVRGLDALTNVFHEFFSHKVLR